MAEKTQKTDKGLEIPIPTKRDMMSALAKTARPKSEQKPRKDRRRKIGKNPL